MPEISSTGDQMLAVLGAVFRHGPVTTTRIAAILGINRTVAHRLINTLHRRAYVRRKPDGYLVGPMVVHLARAVEPELRRVAIPVMARLADETEETIVLHSIDGDEAVVVDQAVSDRHVLRVQHQPGSRSRLGAGASGRVLLAFQSRPVIERLLGAADDAAAMRQQIEQVRHDGYAASSSELQLGVCGIAAPILGADGTAHASIAVLAPLDREQGLTGHVARLRQAADDIAAALAASPG